MIPATINITAVEQVGDYALHLSFDDGTAQMVDFKPFLSLSHHPDIRAYLTRALRGISHQARRIGVGQLRLALPHRRLVPEPADAGFRAEKGSNHHYARLPL